MGLGLEKRKKNLRTQIGKETSRSPNLQASKKKRS